MNIVRCLPCALVLGLRDLSEYHSAMKSFCAERARPPCVFLSLHHALTAEYVEVSVRQRVHCRTNRP